MPPPTTDTQNTTAILPQTNTTTTVPNTSQPQNQNPPSSPHKPAPPTTPPLTLLSLPPELRVQIYTHILTDSTSPSPPPLAIRPHRKIGWNRPYATLTTPSQLFAASSDCHAVLKRLFSSKLCRGDHALILGVLMGRVRVMVVEHGDLLGLIKVVEGRGGSGGLGKVVRENLRVLDFSDRMDEIVCQPNDLDKLVRGLSGLRSIWLSSRHVQRYSGSIEEHVEFVREREERERLAGLGVEKGDLSTAVPLDRVSGGDSHSVSDSDSTSPSTTTTAAAELRRLTLRSPMTDGTRLLITPTLDIKSSLNSDSARNSPTWVVVDLSMLIWQHFLYVGPPYRDHWRPHKIRKLLDVAEKCGVDVVFGLRNIEFDPLPESLVVGSAGVGDGRRSQRWRGGGGAVFRGEMSTKDWVLRLRQVRGVGSGSGVEYCVKQRRKVFEDSHCVV